MRRTIHWRLLALFFALCAAAPARGQAPSSIASYELAGTQLAIDASPDSGVRLTMRRDSVSGTAWFAPADIVAWADSLGAAAWIPTHEASTTKWFRFGGVIRSTNGRFGLGVLREIFKDSSFTRLVLAADGPRDSIIADLHWKQLDHVVGLMLFAASRVDSFTVFAPDHAYYGLGITKAVTARRDNPTPRWPPSLVGRSRGATVLVQFVVDTAGQPLMFTYSLIQTTDMVFADEVRRILPAYRFNPAELDGRPILSWVRLPFVFAVR